MSTDQQRCGALALRRASLMRRHDFAVAMFSDSPRAKLLLVTAYSLILVTDRLGGYVIKTVWKGQALSLALACGVVSSGCAVQVDDGEPPESLLNEDIDGDLGVVSQALGTINGTDVNNHIISRGSETALTSTYSEIDGFVVNAGYNTWADPLVTFNNNSRQVRRGASLMGFTTSTYDGTVRASGRMTVPQGWAVLWGDPAIVASKLNPNQVFLASLAVPNSKFPASGVIEGSPSTPANNSDGNCGALIGGACLAKSSDGGRTYYHYACLQDIDTTCPRGAFYDGADLESGPDGRIWAAFRDVQRSRTVVWTTNGTSGITRVNSPTFTASSHPRLRWGPRGLYVLMRSGGNLVLSRYDGTASGTGTWTAPVTIEAVTQADVQLSDRILRLGPQYDLAVGKNESGADEIRAIYTVQASGGRKHIRIARCTTGTTITCTPNVWRTDSDAGQQWGPAIAFGYGNLSGAPSWQISFYSTRNNPNGNTVELWRGTASAQNGVFSLSTQRQEAAQTACPDSRGYWGDYDDMVGGYFGQFFRGFTDSSHGTCARVGFTSSPHGASLSGWYVN